MPTGRANTQMFALPAPPPQRIDLPGGRYRLARVFKHDFFAATCLYEADGPADPPRVVVKLGRVQGFCGLPMRWIGRFLRDREESIYRVLRGVEGIPRYIGRVGQTGCAIEYVEGRPLDHPPPPPPGFFDHLREVFDAIHARGVAYTDANKRSNIIIRPDGEPCLIDYQLAIRRRPDLPPPLRTIVRRVVRFVAGRDLYHLYKHKRRIAPDEMTPEEHELSRRPSGLHGLHRRLTKPYRTLRRKFLSKQYKDGRLASPTASMEDHHQPEKESWRKP